MSLLDNLPLTSAFEQCLKERMLLSTRVAVCLERPREEPLKHGGKKGSYAEGSTGWCRGLTSLNYAKRIKKKKKKTQLKISSKGCHSSSFLLIDHVPRFW